jgi:hypothetical protein
MARSVFLLSPANMNGLRARQLMSPRASFQAAELYRTADGVPIALAFAFMSALYFRGKITILKRTPVDAKKRNYRKPLERDARALAENLDDDAQVVLLGSVASGKYVDILWPIFGDRLRFPTAFAGLGDMSRGGLLLRAARADRELTYTTLEAPRHRVGGGSGKMPSLDIAAAK